MASVPADRSNAYAPGVIPLCKMSAELGTKPPRRNYGWSGRSAFAYMIACCRIPLLGVRMSRCRPVPFSPTAAEQVSAGRIHAIWDG